MAGRKPKVVVALSGGVDSSVAAAMLLQQGYQVVGCFMRLGSGEEDSLVRDGEDCRLPEPHEHGEHGRAGHQGCCSVADAGDARLVAAILDIPFYVLNFRRDFGRVIDYFVREYNAGRTPNPCVRCNDWLKFGKLLSYARTIDADYIATGHYARVGRGPEGGARLLRGRDGRKDQSYVLFGTDRAALDRMLLPIGEHEKAAVRQMARDWSLPVFDKPDSQEICFVPDNDYAGLIRRRTPEHMQPGQVLDRAGRVVGEHPGQQHFTIGQRRGLGVATGVPLYVIDKNAQANTITVGTAEDTESTGLTADQCNWLIDPPEVGRSMSCQAKVRSNSPPTPAVVTRTGPDRLALSFEHPQRAVTPGQAVVCYDGEVVLGGGWIDAVVR